ncbi:hypothetical protein LOTGIDRAFT_161502 [Lottia gigantea]|uniref:Uncharacterized protein n=1 Tax=Lottia gigantea TaxID=225164 RepID=V4ABT9_LOTGI|nr:hypothetical protein LOTGIDRAFT_161502 [Lottia gigantea]ESO94282.1 hypothetical protein LOTGIDRAFT_161502 [Lottia gigantea]
METKFGVKNALEVLDFLDIDNDCSEYDSSSDHFESVEPAINIPLSYQNNNINEILPAAQNISNDESFEITLDEIYVIPDTELSTANVIIDHESNITTIIDNDKNAKIHESNISTIIDSDKNAKIPETANAESRPSRKRKKNQAEWAKNVRKRRRQSGKEYTDSNGNLQRKRSLKYDTNHTYGCLQIYTEFWTLNDSQKKIFYNQTTSKERKARTRLPNTEFTSRKQFTYKYHLKKSDENIRVCKQFYLDTLDISQTRIQTFHEKDERGNIRYSDKRGAHSCKNIINTEPQKEIIRNHIKSFPTIPSHYCRANSKRQYLEPGLTVQKMYNLYVDNCNRNEIKPLKLYVYRDIFNLEFNIGFHVPKKDKCDTCEKYIILTSQPNVNEINAQTLRDHLNLKQETKIERDTDRNRKDNSVVVRFDMQNVMTCPRASVSNFFYKRKLSVFNLTAHCSYNKVAYNAIWTDNMMGRGANEIASALCVILQKVCEDIPNINHLILWSDACVPQNKNSIMVTALTKFVERHSGLIIEHKFGTPGHSSIQEVDNVHSHIEKALGVAEIYSPISLVRVLLKVRPKHMKVIQMKKSQFFDFQKVSQRFKFNIPFCKLNYLRIDSSRHMQCDYKFCFSEELKTHTISRKKPFRIPRYWKKT